MSLHIWFWSSCWSDRCKSVHSLCIGLNYTPRFSSSILVLSIAEYASHSAVCFENCSILCLPKIFTYSLGATFDILLKCFWSRLLSFLFVGFELSLCYFRVLAFWSLDISSIWWSALASIWDLTVNFLITDSSWERDEPSYYQQHVTIADDVQWNPNKRQPNSG